MPVDHTTQTHPSRQTRLLKFLDIQQHELKVVLPLSLMLFLVCCSCTLLRNMKNIMILEIGSAELMSYLKSFGALPLGISFTLVYSFGLSKFSKQTVFYSSCSFFIAIFSIVMILYPLRDKIQPERGSLEAIYPSSLRPIATAFENWIIVIIFLTGELYGTIMISVLTWGFVLVFF
jgi:AAA family ATP:ADP antiporter